MTQPVILGIAIGVPANKHQQMDIHDRWLSPYIHSQRARAIFAAAEIETRYSVLASASFLAANPSTQARNDLFIQAARPLAGAVINQALAKAGLAHTNIDHFIVVSCTGFDNPGLDVLVAADLGLRSDLRRTAIIGMGCHAGLTGLDRAILEILARPQQHVLLLAVEFGTLHFQHGHSLENMVAGALFGDGLAAVVVGSTPTGAGQPRLLDTMTYSDYNSQDLMGFHLSDTGFQIRLATSIPKILKSLVPDLVTGFLSRANLTLADIRFWGIHPGGAKILDYVGAALALPEEALRYSRTVLRDYGNMSSATIFFVLDDIIQQGRPQPGDYALLLAFGPGLTIELCLAQW